MSEFDDLPPETRKYISEYETTVCDTTKNRLLKAFKEKKISINFVLLSEVAGLAHSMAMCLSFLPIKTRTEVMGEMHRVILKTAKQRSGSLGFLQEIETEVSGEMNRSNPAQSSGKESRTGEIR